MYDKTHVYQFISFLSERCALSFLKSIFNITVHAITSPHIPDFFPVLQILQLSKMITLDFDDEPFHYMYLDVDCKNSITDFSSELNENLTRFWQSLREVQHLYLGPTNNVQTGNNRMQSQTLSNLYNAAQKEA